jgi:endonuclease YncB( thermonuclease family)
MSMKDVYNVQRFRLWFFGLSLLLCGVLYFQAEGLCREVTAPGTVFSAQVVKIIDGDTIEVRWHGEDLRMRLWGIDCPEQQQGFSRNAREFSKRSVQGRRVEVRVKTWDKYGRLVALVEVDGSLLNEELLRAGLAWVHIYYCKEPVCREWRRLEKEARMAGRGLWQEKNPVPPWKWKQSYWNK